MRDAPHGPKHAPSHTLASNAPGAQPGASVVSAAADDSPVVPSVEDDGSAAPLEVDDEPEVDSPTPAVAPGPGGSKHAPASTPSTTTDAQRPTPLTGPPRSRAR